MVGFCSGLISGLVAATPASGYLPPHASILLGVCSGVICNYGTKVKNILRIDDTMDVFAEHGIAGMVGLIFNALFAADYIIGLDGVSTGVITGGWLNHNWKQLYIQVAYIVAVSAYSFVVTLIICYAINAIPGLKLRADEEAELLGMDDDQLGEFAYDYVEVRRDYLAWTPAKAYHDAPTMIANDDRHGIDYTGTLNGHSPDNSTHRDEPAQQIIADEKAEKQA
jgi:Amt family ammonium transporter